MGNGESIVLKKNGILYTVKNVDGTVKIVGKSVNASEIKFKGDYSDTTSFAYYLDSKIKTVLGVRTSHDIDVMAADLAQKFNVSQKDALKVISGLTQFSSSRQLTEIGAKFQKDGIGGIFTLDKLTFTYDEAVRLQQSGFGRFYAKDYKGSSLGITPGADCHLDELSINNVLDYVGVKKNQFFTTEQALAHYFDYSKPSPRLSGSKQAFVLDSQGLDTLAKMKQAKLPQYADFVKKVNNGEIVLYSVDGWNISTKDGIVTSGLFGQTSNIEELAGSVIQRMKTEGISLEQALKGDICAKASSVFGNDIPSLGSKIKPISGSISSDSSAIASRLAPNMPSSKEIIATIDTIVESKISNTNPALQQRAKTLLSWYYDEMLTTYSSESFVDQMLVKHTEIARQVKTFGKTMDDVVYVIPTAGKSFDVLAYQYAQVNGIPSSQIVHYNGSAPMDLSGKVVVVLDDIVGSADTMLGQEFKYAQQNASNVIIAPFTSLKSGANRITGTISSANRVGKDAFIPATIVDYEQKMAALSSSDRKLLEKVLGSIGWSQGGASTAMPYMLPDNNTQASGVLLNWFINNIDGDKNASGNARLLYAVLQRLANSK